MCCGAGAVTLAMVAVESLRRARRGAAGAFYMQPDGSLSVCSSAFAFLLGVHIRTTRGEHACSRAVVASRRPQHQRRKSGTRERLHLDICAAAYSRHLGRKVRPTRRYCCCLPTHRRAGAGMQACRCGRAGVLCGRAGVRCGRVGVLVRQGRSAVPGAQMQLRRRTVCSDDNADHALNSSTMA